VRTAAVEAFLREADELVSPYLSRLLTRSERGGAAFRECMAYTLFAPAKRFRPALTLAAVRAAGGRGPEGLPVMAAVELLHTYSLIHDDLPCMDDDDVRRGKPACHKVYGVGLAMLAGDALQSLAFDVLARAAADAADGGAREIRAMLEVTSAAGPEGMAAGQALDLAATGRAAPDVGGDRAAASGDLPVSPVLVEEMHRLKTGALLRAAVVGGAHLAGAPEPELGALRRYADALGLAFQAADDLLNVEGDSALIGKSVGSDASAGKTTLPALLGVEAARRRARDLSEECVRALAPLGAGAMMLAGLAEYAVSRNR